MSKRDLDLAWAAGFFDGEGFVTIQNRKHRINGVEYRGYYLRIGVNHVRREPLEKLVEIFPDTTIRVDKSTKGNRRPRTVWAPSCQKAARILEQMLPYLVNKAQVAKLGIELQSRISSKNKYKLTAEEEAMRKWFKEEIMRLNAKG